MQKNTRRKDDGSKSNKKTKKSSSNNPFGYFGFILVASVILSLTIILVSNDVFAFTAENKDIIVSFPEDSSKSQVAKILDEEGVIKYRTVFKLFTLLTANDSEFEAGQHTLNSSMDYRAIIKSIRKRPDVVKVVIPEGYTVEQVKQVLLDKGVCEEERLTYALEDYPFKHDFLQDVGTGENRLEGYLFPDTYEFYVNSDAVKVVNTMLNNFNSKFSDELRQQADKLGMTIDEAVILASLIEREAKVSDEQVKISGVIHNRLDSFKYPYLNIDATIQYVVGHKEALTASDLKINSPYNTYTHKGLPPGAIANPGLGALYAAVNPEKHDYYFYVASGDEAGSHIFTKTLKEHNAAVAKVKEGSGS